MSNPCSRYRQFRRKVLAWVLLSISVGIIAVACGGRPSQQQASGFAPELVTDYIYTVLKADLDAYTWHVADRAKTLESNRIANGVLNVEVTEAWEQTDGIPIPAQMFRLGSEIASENSDLSYQLLSPWNLHDNQGPETGFEATAMAAVIETGQPYRGYWETGGQAYYSGMYPVRAVAEACITCHNTHPDHLKRYPDKKFSIGDVMGTIMVNIPVEGT